MLGWSQQQLADKAGVPLASLRGYGPGQLPDWGTLVRLADALGVSPGVLVACDEVAKAEGAKAARSSAPALQKRPRKRKGE